MHKNAIYSHKLTSFNGGVFRINLCACPFNSFEKIFAEKELISLNPIQNLNVH